MDNFFYSEKEYNQKMLHYFANLYLLFHTYFQFDYYIDNIYLILFYCLPLYFIIDFMKLDYDEINNIQIILTTILILHDLKDNLDIYLI